MNQKRISLKQKSIYDYDDVECRGIKDIRDLFNLWIDKDYYKPVIFNQ